MRRLCKIWVLWQCATTQPEKAEGMELESVCVCLEFVQEKKLHTAFPSSGLRFCNCRSHCLRYLADGSVSAPHHIEIGVRWHQVQTGKHLNTFFFLFVSLSCHLQCIIKEKKKQHRSDPGPAFKCFSLDLKLGLSVVLVALFLHVWLPGSTCEQAAHDAEITQWKLLSLLYNSTRRSYLCCNK